MLTKSQARTFFVGGTVLFSGLFFALTIDTHRRVPKQTNADQITPAVVAGKKIWEENNCMGCHTLFGEGAYYAPELTKTVERRGEAWLRVFLKDPEAMYPGRRKMVKYDFSEEDLTNIIAFFDWCGKVDLNGFPADPPLRAKLEGATVSSAAPVKLLPSPPPAVMVNAACTGCHSVAGEGGAAGALIGAPPLDGVHATKSREELRQWISDPQKIKPGTAMPDLVPALVSEEQLEEILDYLFTNADEKPAA
jgi:nitric oxide reductase subunit C